MSQHYPFALTCCAARVKEPGEIILQQGRLPIAPEAVVRLGVTMIDEIAAALRASPWPAPAG